jgi:hypothetical protein
VSSEEFTYFTNDDKKSSPCWRWRQSRSGDSHAFLETNMKVSVLTRDATSKSYSENLNIFETDYSYDSIAKAMAGQDAVVSVVGFSAAREQLKL